jgi:hypothetical protein
MLRSRKRLVSVVLIAVVALALFLSTLQIDISGSRHPYATDVGEIQNAFPRWGLIHHSGYPLYTAVGSLFTNALWLTGIEPAAGASLFSALWGAVSVGLLCLLALELGASRSASMLGALAVAVSQSVWVDSSLAEVHTLTLVFTVGTLIFAVRFGRDGRTQDLLLLTLFFSQGVMHQRSVVLLAPTVAFLIWPHVRAIRRSLGSIIGVSILAPLTYLYLPFRAWTGVDWVFGSPGTWRGVWAMILDNRADRIAEWPASPTEWLENGKTTLRIITDDMWWPLLLAGLAALLVIGFRDRKWRVGLALTLAWLSSVPLTFLISGTRVRDSQLAAKLPVVLMAGLGLALIITWLQQRSRLAGVVASVVLLAVLSAWGWRVRPFVLSVTRDDSAEAIIAKAQRVAPPPDGKPATLVLPWGPDYWAVAYAQGCRSQLPGLGVVDHNADFRAIVDRGDHLLVLDETLYIFPVPWWESVLGPLHLASAAPDVIELSPTPPVDRAAVSADIAFDLGNGVQVRSLSMDHHQENELFVSIYWEATTLLEEDYRVAVHLVARDPPEGAEDVLAQADSPHPVSGWYPTSRWHIDEVVRDDYAIDVPAETSPVAVRVAMYQLSQDGSFNNTAWLSHPYRPMETRRSDGGGRRFSAETNEYPDVVSTLTRLDHASNRSVIN